MGLLGLLGSDVSYCTIGFCKEVVVSIRDLTYMGLDALVSSRVGLVLPFVVVGSFGSHSGRCCGCAGATSVSPLREGDGGVLVGIISSLGDAAVF